MNSIVKWAVAKASNAKTSTWVIVILSIILLLGAGVAGTALVLRKRKLGLLVHERNKLLEEKRANRVKQELASNISMVERLKKEGVGLEEKIKKTNDRVTSLGEKHRKVKLALEDVSSWDDLNIE